MFGAFARSHLIGTVTLFLATPPNQPFRAEIWKLMVAQGGLVATAIYYKRI